MNGVITDGRLADSAVRRRAAGAARHVAMVLLALAMLGATEVALAQAISPRRLVEVVDIGNPVISPDGRYVAFRTEQASVERNTYDTVWWVQRLGAGTLPLRVADGGIPLREAATGLVLASPAQWSPDNRWIYYRALIDGKVAVWRAAADGSGAGAVTHDAADVRDFELHRDGRRLRYSVGATREAVIDAESRESHAGIHIDDSTFVGAGLVRSSTLGERAATQRFHGGWFDPGPLLGDTPDRWKTLDLADGVLSPGGLAAPAAKDAGDEGMLKRVTHASDGRIGLLQQRASGGASGGTAISVVGAGTHASAATCSAEACTAKNITDVAWRPDTDELLFTIVDRKQGRAHRLYLWNVVTGTARQVLESRGTARGSSQRFQDVPCAISRQTLVCVTAEADRPPRLEAVDLETGVHTSLFEPNLLLAKDLQVAGRARLLRWTDVRGDAYTGWLFPAQAGETGTPLFVTLYTCDGFLRGGLGDEWPLASMAQAGISAICINGNPVPFVMEDYYGQAIRAIESVASVLAREGLVDPERIGMGGLSHGSEMTMWTASHSGLLSAASVASPSITPNWYLFNSLRDTFRDTVEVHWGLDDPRTSPGRWREVSPAFKLDRIAAPVLFQMSEQEWLFALEYALPLVRRSQADVYVFPNEPHIKFQPRHKLAAYQRNLDWFRFWLLDEEDPGREREQQYVKWREMRLSSSGWGAGASSGSGLAPQPVLDHAQVEDAHERQVIGSQGRPQRLPEGAQIKQLP
jgi:dipeptidyl aminopeptidase/acylaminoacyl peptidase